MYSACWPYKQATETPVTGFTSLCSFMSIAASTVKCHLLVNGQTLKATVVYMCTWMFTAGVCGRWWHIGPSQYRRRPGVISVQSLAVVFVHMNVYSWFVWTLVAHWAQSISSPTWCRISTIPIHRVLCRQTLPSACASISLSVLSSLPTFIPSTKSRYCQQITPAFTWQHLHCGDCLEAKGEYYQNCFMMCCVRQLCAVIHTIVWAVLKSACLFGLYISLFVFCKV